MLDLMAVVTTYITTPILRRLLQDTRCGNPTKSHRWRPREWALPACVALTNINCPLQPARDVQSILGWHANVFKLCQKSPKLLQQILALGFRELVFATSKLDHPVEYLRDF